MVSVLFLLSENKDLRYKVFLPVTQMGKTSNKEVRGRRPWP